MEDYVIVYSRGEDQIRCYIFDKESCKKVYNSAEENGITIFGVYKKINPTNIFN